MEVKGFDEVYEWLDFMAKESPKEMKKALNKGATEGRKVLRKKGRSRVKDHTGNYNRHFYKGKFRNEGASESAIRIGNSSKHAHLIEYGYATKGGTFVEGKFVIRDSEKEVEEAFNKGIEKAIDKFFK